MSALSRPLEFVTYNNTVSVAVVYPNNTTTTQVYYSNKEQGTGYFNAGNGLQTVMYTCDPTFVGTVTMQATLATDPSDTDWFNVRGTTSTYTVAQSRNTSTVDIYNFTGNFVWVRGVVSINSGQVSSVLYNR
jgi:hypothetical protein